MPDLAYQSLAVLALLLALVLLYWSMFRDRSRGRRRCPRCWYDLRGSDSLSCSECGHTARREQQFYRTRRRWRWVVVVVLIGFGAAALWLTPRARRDGWLTLMPTTIVIASLQWTGEDGVGVLVDRWSDPGREAFPRSGVWSWQERFAQWQARRLVDSGYETETRRSMLSFLSWWFDPPEDLGPIILVWLDDEDPAIRRSAASYAGHEELGSASIDPIVKRLRELMEDPDPEVQQAATWSLQRFINESPAALSSLIEGMSSPSSDVRSISAFAMIRLEAASLQVLSRLCELIESQDRAASAAARALGSIGDASVAQSLIVGVGGSGRDVSRECAVALLRLGEEVRSAENTAALIALLNSTNADLRAAVIAALMGQGMHAVQHSDYMKNLLDSETASDLTSLLDFHQQRVHLTSEVAVPVLLAIAAQAMENPEWGTERQYELGHVPRLLGGFPDRADDSVPLLMTLLGAPRFDLRESAISALAVLGPAAAPALPSLRARMDETTNPAEDKLLEEAIAAIEGGEPDQ